MATVGRIHRAGLLDGLCPSRARETIMISVKLPDGSAKELSDGASSADLAKAISDGLARVAVAAKVNGAIVDLAKPLPDGAQVQILT
jgi:threonyl-tRNA synthetase